MYPTLYEGIHDPALKQVYQQSGLKMYPTLYEGIHDPALKTGISTVRPSRCTHHCMKGYMIQP